MYECPNCAANLRYHITKKKLYCDSCETTMDPYAYQKDKDAEESNDYEVTIFTCPQCGGEIINEETTAATFCSYCGASTILDSRISKERRPKYIIPFAKTKADCKRAYSKVLSEALFAPDELKDSEHIEKFRGIYMPYWTYSFEKKEPVKMLGCKTRRSGDYLISKHYNIDTELDISYEGIAFDASATFSDSLSNAIAPFDIKKGKPFTPSFLSGFYADTSDLEEKVYAAEAEALFRKDAGETLKKKKEFSKYGLGEEEKYSLEVAMRPTAKSADLCLFPVWFLSYRKNDRVAYAVVNGQNGRVAADLPIDIKKYLVGSLLIALPIFVLLNLFFTLKPSAILIFAIIFAFICLIIANVQLTRIIKREKMEDDKGLLQYMKKPGNSKTSRFPILIKPIIAIVLAICILIAAPAEDMIYYIGSIVCMVTMGFVVFDCVKMHNLLTTRKLPQLGRRGGDENA